MAMETRDSDDHTDKTPDIFKQHYAGTFVAGRYRAYNDPINDPTTKTQETADPERELLPMELQRIGEWFKTLNHNAVTAVFTVGIFVATAVYAVVATLQWSAMRQQSSTMQRQLEMADRPWIKDAVRSASDFTAQHGAFSWAVTIRTENVGHSVASAIYPEAKLIAIHGADFLDSPRLQARQLCDEVSARFERVKNDPVVWSNAIFPGEWSEFLSNTVLLPTDIQGVSLDAKNSMPMLIGCIEYHYATSAKPHHTWFVYTLTHSDDPSLPPDSRMFFPMEKAVPSANMVLIKADQFAD
jgi:hypothetical protein